MPTFMNLFTYQEFENVKGGFLFKKCTLLIDTVDHKSGEYIENIDLSISMHVWDNNIEDFEEFVLEQEHI